MFKLVSMLQFPAPAPSPVHNHFDQYVVAMPQGLMTVLQKRIYTVLLHKFYGVDVPHDLSTNHLIELDDLLLASLLDEAHNYLLNHRHLALLERFLKAERMIANQAKLQLVPKFSNAQYWNLTGELLQAVAHPVQVISLSFLGR